MNTAIEGAADLTDTEKESAELAAATAMGRITGAKQALAAKEEEDRKAKEEADRKAAETMAATAAKLYSGIAGPSGDAATTTAAGTALSAGERGAAYNNSDVPSGNIPTTPVDTLIMVGIGIATPVALSEDKDTTVAALNGWTGKRYHRTTPSSEGTYEAHVYSHVGEPTQGDKFGQVGVTVAADGYQYGLNADGILSTDVETTPTQIASPSFDQSAGVKSFELGTNREYVSISGTYHGVSGEYRCTPGSGNTCAAQVATQGFRPWWRHRRQCV